MSTRTHQKGQRWFDPHTMDIVSATYDIVTETEIGLNVPLVQSTQVDGEMVIMKMTSYGWKPTWRWQPKP